MGTQCSPTPPPPPPLLCSGLQLLQRRGSPLVSGGDGGSPVSSYKLLHTSHFSWILSGLEDLRQSWPMAFTLSTSLTNQQRPPGTVWGRI